jgi:hypothetical protein
VPDASRIHLINLPLVHKGNFVQGLRRHFGPFTNLRPIVYAKKTNVIAKCTATKPALAGLRYSQGRQSRSIAPSVYMVFCARLWPLQQILSNRLNVTCLAAVNLWKAALFLDISRPINALPAACSNRETRCRCS